MPSGQQFTSTQLFFLVLLLSYWCFHLWNGLLTTPWGHTVHPPRVHYCFYPVEASNTHLPMTWLTAVSWLVHWAVGCRQWLDQKQRDGNIDKQQQDEKKEYSWVSSRLLTHICRAWRCSWVCCFISEQILARTPRKTVKKDIKLRAESRHWWDGELDS